MRLFGIESKTALVVFPALVLLFALVDAFGEDASYDPGQGIDDLARQVFSDEAPPTIFGTNVSRGRLSTGQFIARIVTRSVTNKVVGGVVADLGKPVGGTIGSSVGRALVRGALGGLLRG